MEKILKLKKNSKVIAGIGSALMDILIQESDQFLKEIDAEKGVMLLADYEKITSVLEKSSKPPSMAPGGSACNTIMGIGKLSNNAIFVGKVGKDKLGYDLESTLNRNNVTPLLSKSETQTGRAVSIITPDAQRSFFTFLGAASELTPDEISPEKFKDAAIVHIEGYLVFNEELFMKALKSAKEANALISLDLASVSIVNESKELLKSVIPDYIDILLANEDEAKAFTGIYDEKEALKNLSEDVKIAVLKLGKRGSLISYNNQIYEIGIHGNGEAVDTTGAGDLWAAGFLYGLVKGLPIDICGDLGALCGYEVCQVIGAHIPDEGWERIKAQI